jgi:lysozyme
LKGSEGLKLVAYHDGGGVPTIGHGHTRTVTHADVGVKRITEVEAQHLFESDIAPVVQSVNRVGSTLPFQLSQNQFDALCAFVFNIGVPRFEGVPQRVKTSTLVQCLRAGDIQGAADQMLRWNKDNGQVVKGLTTRRERERAWFLEPDKTTAAVVPVAGGNMGALAALLGGFVSKKFVVTSITAFVITFGDKLGIHLDKDVLNALLTAVVPYILCQGVLDWAKIRNAAKNAVIAAANTLATPDNPDAAHLALAEKPTAQPAVVTGEQSGLSLEFLGAEKVAEVAGSLAPQLATTIADALGKMFGQPAAKPEAK